MADKVNGARTFLRGPYRPYQSGFNVRRGETDTIVGHITVEETDGMVRVITHRYDDLGLVTDLRTYTPDEAIELSGALEAAANAVWERANQTEEN
jgi:hypothetical protein